MVQGSGFGHRQNTAGLSDSGLTSIAISPIAALKNCWNLVRSYLRAASSDAASTRGKAGQSRAKTWTGWAEVTFMPPIGYKGDLGIERHGGLQIYHISLL